MIGYQTALRLVLKNAPLLSGEQVPIIRACGRIAAEDIVSPLNIPPFNKSSMDGYAVHAADVRKAPVALRCVGSVQAGGSFTGKVKRGECIKIMCGAPLPRGTDAVVIVENTRQHGDRVTIRAVTQRGDYVCRKGEDITAGRKVLKKGTLITLSHIGLLATVGRTTLRVVRAPRVALINTGGEIVAPGKVLPKNKIFNANGPQLVAVLSHDLCHVRFLGIVKDQKRALSKTLPKGLKADVLLVSGGVSLGDYDLVPEVLMKLGVRRIFHKVKIKPGKPLFFGAKGRTLVFGIPGNPVSAFAAYQLFIRSALRKMMGRTDYRPHFRSGTTTGGFKHIPGRRHFVLVRIKKAPGTYLLTPLPGNSSADVLALAQADGFMVVDEKTEKVPAGTSVPFITWKTL